MTDHKLISICIPTYNREKDLEAALKTILPQLGPDVEVIVSDNCSTDGTRKIVERYQGAYPGLRYSLNPTNVGFDRNMLRCVELAEGEYVWYFGSDDLLKPGGVDAVRQALQGRPTMVFLNHEIFDESGRTVLKSMVGWGKDLKFHSASLYMAVVGHNFSFITALVLRKDLCLQVDDIESVIGTGWIHLHMVLWILAHGHLFRFVGRPYVRARSRRVGGYDASTAFVRANRIYWNARKYGHPLWTLYLLGSRAMIRAVVVERMRGSRSIRELVPFFVRAYWMFPHFWVLVLPLIFLPRRLFWFVRQAYRHLRNIALGWKEASPEREDGLVL